MRIMLVGSAIAALATPVAAGDWRLVYADDHDAIAIEADSIRSVVGKKVAWVALLRAEPEEGVDYSLSRREFDCSASTVTPLSFVAYRANGESIHSSHSRRPTQAVVPDTLGWEAFDAVCFGTDMDDMQGWSSPSVLLSDYRTR